MVWTDEMETLLRSLWEKNYSARRIAIEMQCGITRNAVIGKSNRMGLPMRRIKSGCPIPKGVPAPKRKPPRSRSWKPAIIASPPVAPIVLSGPPGGVFVEELTRHNCRAIIGSERLPMSDRDVSKYCGAPAVPGKSWCQAHFARYTQPARSRL